MGSKSEQILFKVPILSPVTDMVGTFALIHSPDSCWCPGTQGNIVSCSGTREAESGAGQILGSALLFTTDLSNSPSRAKNGKEQKMTEMLPLGVQNTSAHLRDLEMKVNKQSCVEK